MSKYVSSLNKRRFKLYHIYHIYIDSIHHQTIILLTIRGKARLATRKAGCTTPENGKYSAAEASSHLCMNNFKHGRRLLHSSKTSESLWCLSRSREPDVFLPQGHFTPWLTHCVVVLPLPPGTVEPRADRADSGRHYGLKRMSYSSPVLRALQDTPPNTPWRPYISLRPSTEPREPAKSDQNCRRAIPVRIALR